MAHAYTPGLKVAARTRVRKLRRLPLKGEVLVQPGQRVSADTVVARTLLPGDPVTVNVAHRLGLDPSEVPAAMLKREGERVAAGEVIARATGLFGLFRRELRSPVDGTVELISAVTGQVTLRQPPTAVEVRAYVDGVVVEVLPGEGAVVEAEGAFIQGIFGIGGETHGVVRVRVAGPGDVLDADAIDASCRGAVVVGGSLVTAAALARAREVGVRAVVSGGILDTDLAALLGYDLGVAITGHEDVGLTVVVTEGFGPIRMAERTFRLLQAVEGLAASVNGATQIRAGVQRPEVIVPGFVPREPLPAAGDGEGHLDVGTPVRIIREPYFGALATVVELPPEPVPIETEARVRILRARLEDGRVVTVPRANVEIIEVA